MLSISTGDASNFDVYEEDTEPYGKPGNDPYADKVCGMLKVVSKYMFINFIQNITVLGFLGATFPLSRPRQFQSSLETTITAGVMRYTSRRD